MLTHFFPRYVADPTARKNAEAEDQNHMDSFLRNLHHRTQAIPGTPAAKRLKVFLSYCTDGEIKRLGETGGKMEESNRKGGIDFRRRVGETRWKRIKIDRKMKHGDMWRSGKSGNMVGLCNIVHY